MKKKSRGMKIRRPAKITMISVSSNDDVLVGCSGDSDGEIYTRNERFLDGPFSDGSSAFREVMRKSIVW